MSDIEIGSEWIWTNADGEVVVEVIDVATNEHGETIVTTEEDDGEIQYDDIDYFLANYKPKTDMVNHPPHYKDASGIDATFDDDIALQTFGELPAKRMRLIGIAGKARSGKDTAAKYLLNKLGDDWSSASFADPMKAMLNAIDIDCSDAAKDLPKNQYGVSTRHMLQTLGTEWGRDGIGSNFWIDVFANMNAYQCVIVPDVRFENEAELIREHGVLICIEGRGGIEGGHISERKLQYDDRDIYIDNRGSLSELYEKLDSIDFDSE